MFRMVLSGTQVWSLHSLMCTVLKQGDNMDIRPGVDDPTNVRVTIWHNGDPTAYEIRVDGTTLAA